MEATTRPERVPSTSSAQGSRSAAAAARASACSDGSAAAGITSRRSAPAAASPAHDDSSTMLVTAVTVPETQAASSAASPSNSEPTPGSVKKHQTEFSPGVGLVPPGPRASRVELAGSGTPSSDGSSLNAPNSSSRSTASATEDARRALRVAVSTRTGPTEVGEPRAPSCSAGMSRSAAASRTTRSPATLVYSSGGALEGAHSRSAVDSAAGRSPVTVQ